MAHIMYEYDMHYYRCCLEGLKLLKFLHDEGFDVQDYPTYKNEGHEWSTFPHYEIFLRFITDMGFKYFSHQIFMDYKKNEETIKNIALQSNMDFEDINEEAYIIILPRLSKKNKKRIRKVIDHHASYVVTMRDRKKDLILYFEDLEFLDTETMRMITKVIFNAYIYDEQVNKRRNR